MENKFFSKQFNFSQLPLIKTSIQQEILYGNDYTFILLVFKCLLFIIYICNMIVTTKI